MGIGHTHPINIQKSPIYVCVKLNRQEWDLHISTISTVAGEEVRKKKVYIYIYIDIYKHRYFLLHPTFAKNYFIIIIINYHNLLN